LPGASFSGAVLGAIVFSEWEERRRPPPKLMLLAL
jgi:hypothetical protein